MYGSLLASELVRVLSFKRMSASERILSEMAQGILDGSGRGLLSSSASVFRVVSRSRAALPFEDTRA